VLELIVGKLACLWEAVHAALDFHVDMAIVDKCMQLVVVHDVRREDSNRDEHVSVISGWHGSA